MISDSGKNMICKCYDDFLSQFISVSTILHGKYNPNITYWDNYDDNSREEHFKNIFENSQTIISKYPMLDNNDVIKFINEPDFIVKTDISNDSTFKGSNSLEDCLIYRYLYEQVVVEPVQKRPCDDFKFREKVRPLTKISMLKLSNNLVYIKEDIFFVSDSVYNSIARYFMLEESNRRDVPLTQVPVDQNLLLKVWNQLDMLGYDHYRCVEPYVGYNLKDFHNMFIERHTKNFKESDFIFVKKMGLDNRKSVASLEEKGLKKTLSLVSQRIS